MENVDDWSFDVFQINETGEGHALKYVGYELLQKYNLISKFKVCSVYSFSRWRETGDLTLIKLYLKFTNIGASNHEQERVMLGFDLGLDLVANFWPWFC